jgi:xanthine dehydrogenase large subunit
VRIESHRLRTHTQSATAFRGFGGPQGMVGIERVMDHIAHALKRDPLAVRRANFYHAMAESAGGCLPPSPATGRAFFAETLHRRVSDRSSPPGGYLSRKETYQRMP